MYFKLINSTVSYNQGQIENSKKTTNYHKNKQTSIYINEINKIKFTLKKIQDFLHKQFLQKKVKTFL